MFVRSEAHSAILPLRRVFQPMRNFLVADIGATTTDIAVVRIGSEQQPYCYAARSAPVGVDTLDARDLAGLHHGPDILTLRVERMQARAARNRAKSVDSGATRPLRDVLSGVLHAAMEKNRDRKRWAALYVVVVGGGSRLPELREIVLNVQAKGWIEQRQQPGLALERPLVVGASTRPSTTDEEYELVSVLGSAVPGWEAGDFTTADRVPLVIPQYETEEPAFSRTFAPWI
jgi:molecular chaperone DnaK (HSP70)